MLKDTTTPHQNNSHCPLHHHLLYPLLDHGFILNVVHWSGHWRNQLAVWFPVSGDTCNVFFGLLWWCTGYVFSESALTFVTTHQLLPSFSWGPELEMFVEGVPEIALVLRSALMSFCPGLCLPFLDFAFVDSLVADLFPLPSSDSTSSSRSSSSSLSGCSSGLNWSPLSDTEFAPSCPTSEMNG